MKNLRKSLTILALALAVVTVSSCKKDEPDPVQDSENLTTLKLNFTSEELQKHLRLRILMELEEMLL
jgi:ABC-type phosphate/phosphonate transport system substrate-binding protein